MSKDRDLKLDNFKGILIFLVVFGHLLFSYTYFNSNNTMILVRFIYSFHMPLFFIISGLLSKNVSSKNLFKLIILFLFVDFSYIIFDYIKYNEFDLFSVKYSSWYLLYLFFYRLFINSSGFKFLVKHYKKVLFLLFIINIFIGFTEFVFVRFLYFLYFFLFGYFLDLKKINFSFHKGLRIVSVSLIFLFGLVFVIPFGLNFLMGLSYFNNIEFLFRGIIMVINCFLFIGIYKIISNKNVFLISRFGKCSLSIYVFHRIFTFLITDFFIDFDYFILISFLFAVILCLLFSNKYLVSFFDRVLNSLWMVYSFHNKLFLVGLGLVVLFLLSFSYRDYVVNSYIKKAVEYMGEDIYMDDGVHPNKDFGVYLYSYATMRN